MYENLRGKRLLFLGAIAQLIESVKIAKEMGIYTIVTDYLPNSPAKAYADKAMMVSTTDVDAIVKLCKEEHVDGIFTAFIDSMLPYAREACDRLGLPFYASKDQIKMSLDKRFFKEKCIEYGVSVPKNYQYGTLTDAYYPVIVKPVDSSGGRGIKVCYTAEELAAAYEFALSVSPGKNVLIEEYVTGTEFTATYTMKNGEVSLSCMKDKILSLDHPGITSQGDVLVYPSSFLDRFIENEDGKIKALLKGMKATDGTVFFQGIANENKIVVFELGYRPNGSCDYRHVSFENNINYLKMMIAHSLTGEMQGYELEMDNPHFSNYVLTFNVWAHGGIVGSMQGKEAVDKLENVIFSEYMHRIGDELPDTNVLAQRVFRAIIRSKNIEDVKNTILQIQKNVKVFDKDGKNMLYSDFDINRLSIYD